MHHPTSCPECENFCALVPRFRPICSSRAAMMWQLLFTSDSRDACFNPETVTLDSPRLFTETAHCWNDIGLARAAVFTVPTPLSAIGIVVATSWWALRV